MLEAFWENSTWIRHSASPGFQGRLKRSLCSGGDIYLKYPAMKHKFEFNHFPIATVLAWCAIFAWPSKTFSHEPEPITNSLSTLFEQYAQDASLNEIVRAYKYGCDIPKQMNSGRGFVQRCKIYDQNGNLVWPNIAFDDKVDVEIFSGSMRGSVETVSISAVYPNRIGIPKQLTDNVKVRFCDPSGMVSSSSRIYTVKISENPEFFVLESSSGGSGGHWGQVHLFRDMQALQALGIRGRFIQVGEPFEVADGVCR